MGSTTLPWVGSRDLFLAQFGADGAHHWAASLAGTGHILGSGLAFDAAGALRLLGRFNGSITVGSKVISAKNNWDAFVAKVQRAGK